MDLDRIKRRQSLKVIASEAVMVIAVILMVAILALIVSGYWINSDFKFERQGLLQISSSPTGADVAIDGTSSWLQKTNTSKVLTSGRHEVVLSKENYDTWSKTINISEGLLYRINYPRLFLKNREVEKLFETTNTTLASFSQNHENILLINGSTEWTLVNLNSDTPERKNINISNYFSNVSLANVATVGLFLDNIYSLEWDKDGSHILFEVGNETNKEWVLLDIKNLNNSINLTKTFGYNFDKVKIINNSSNILLAVHDGNLHRIDLSSKSISSVLVKNIKYFDYRENEIAFSAYDEANEIYNYGLYNIGGEKTTILGDSASPVIPILSKFYDDKNFTVVSNNIVSVYQKEGFSLVESFELSFSPTTYRVGRGGEFIMLSSGKNLASIDMESMLATEWQIEGDTFGWLDDSMIYTVDNGELIVYDYDGLNRRSLSTNVSSRLPVTITNNKWLYYFSDDVLTREWLITR